MNSKKIRPMHRYGYALTLILGLVFTCSAQAQHFLQDNATSAAHVNVSMSIDETATATDNWSLYADESASTYYIDFQSLNVNINEIVLVSEGGKEIWKDNVFDLPVNTIYELDMSHYRPGTYTIELRTFTDVMRKEVDLVR